MSTILFLNHKQERCGIYQYGLRSYWIMKKSNKHRVFYKECESMFDCMDAVENLHPSAIILNYHQATMPWINVSYLKEIGIKIYQIHHEGAATEADYILSQDPTAVQSGNLFGMPRPIFEQQLFNYSHNVIPVIGSFGFGFGHKGFPRVCSLVSKQFERAIIRLHIARPFFGDFDGEVSRKISSACLKEIQNPNVELEISHDFISDDMLMSNLSRNSINVFLYDEASHIRGVSSVLDYAVSINRPVAVSKTIMFRHVADLNPSIFVEDSDIPTIMNRGNGSVLELRNRWSHKNFIDRFEEILDWTL